MNRVLDCRLLSAAAALSIVFLVAPQIANATPKNAVVAPSDVTSFNPRAQLTRIVYKGHAAWRLSDGRTEAIIVPELSRVMAYRFVGGKNVLWNNLAKDPTMYGWKNWGGDKNWFAPQTWWPATSGSGWPPDKAWDGSPLRAEVLSGARLRTTSPVSKTAGVRIIREYSMNAQGELEIKQIAEKVSGAPLLLSIWNISQTHPDAVYLPMNPQSVYKNNYYRFDAQSKASANVQAVTPTLLRFKPIQTAKGAAAAGYKFGVDARVAAFVAVQGDVAFVEKTNFGSGSYPDGPENAGFPVEVYDSAEPDSSKHYIELEMLSPLRLMNKGARWQNTLRWSLQKLKSSDPDSAATHAEIARLLPAPVK